MAETTRALSTRRPPTAASKCRRKFLRFFPKGFKDAKYLAWERDYKWEAHEEWDQKLGRPEFARLLDQGAYAEVAARAVRLESRTNLLFSFEKMALRDAVKSADGAKLFAEGLQDYIYGKGPQKDRFLRFGQVLDGLPRRQTRVHTWPLHTVFGFIGMPEREIFLKPNVTRRAAEEYGFDFSYASRPNWETYASLLEFAQLLSRDLADLEPRDLIDIQSFIWVLGSDEYD
jgi:hypothetical protein